MNTLSKKITPLFYKEEYRDNAFEAIKSHWKSLQDNPDIRLSLEHYILYAILRGKDWRKCFTPITNTVKLTNGMVSDQTLTHALWRLSNRSGDYALFEPIIASDKCQQLVKSLLTGRKAFAYNSSALAEYLNVA
jgi:hypothetical protein